MTPIFDDTLLPPTCQKRVTHQQQAGSDGCLIGDLLAGVAEL